MKKEHSKKIWVIFLLVVIIASLVFMIWYDPYLNKYAGKLKKQYPVIRKLETSGVGPHQLLRLYLYNDVDFKEVEKIFLEIMKDFEAGSLKKYLIESHKKKTGGDMGTVKLSIYYKNKKEMKFYGFTAYLKEGFHTWYYEGGNGDKRTYQVADYIK